jgi:PPP family 3-phenylpropionic acid transporter
MRQIHLLRGYNYLFYSVLAIFISYLPVYYQHQGLSKSEIGILLGVGPIISIFAPPVWGYISDRNNTVKRILLAALGGMMLAGSFLLQQSAFWPLLILTLATYLFLSAINPLSDNLTFRLTEGTNITFGSIRLFGSVGFGLSALAIGWITTRFGMENLFLLFLGLAVPTFLSALFLPDAPVSRSTVRLADITNVLFDRKMLSFIGMVLLVSIPHRTNDGFLSVYVQSVGGDTVQVGQSWFLATFSEAAVFAFSFWWMRKGRELILLSAAAFLYAVRFFLCAVIQDAQILVLLQMMHGVTFAVFYATSLHYLYGMIPDEWKATGQSVFSACFFGISGIVGSFLGGIIFDKWSGMHLYGAMSLMSLCGFFYLIMQVVKAKKATGEEVE